MAEVEGFARSEMFLDDGPLGDDCRIAQKAHDDGAALACFFDGEEGLSGYPSVGHCLVVGLSGALPYNHVEAVVAQVKTLAWPLHSVAEYCECLSFECFERFRQREFFAGDDRLLNTAKIEFCHNFVFLD